MLNLPLSKKQISIKMPSITRHLQSIDKRLDAIEMFVRSLSPRTATVAPLSIDTAIDSFLAHRHFSDLRLKQYEVLRRALHRFELFRRHTVSADYNLAFDRMSADDLYAFDDFLADEHNIIIYMCHTPTSMQPIRRLCAEAVRPNRSPVAATAYTHILRGSGP